MSSLRTMAIAGISSLGLVFYLILWFRWPVTISLAVGAVVAMIVVMTSASLGEDAASADAAWREAAPELMDPPPQPIAGEPTPLLDAPRGTAEGD